MPMAVFNETILRDQVAIVTGGATGIGKVIARTLGRHGAAVVIASRKRDVLDTAQAELQAQGIKCLAMVADVRQPDAIEHVVNATLEHFGRIDILVNNAAGNFPATIDDISYNGFKAVVDIDLLGTYNVTKAVYTAYMRDHGGAIINIAAPFEHWGVTYQAHVAAAKTGVISLTRTCAVEWAARGIRVNAVAPGQVADTEGLDRFEQAVEGITPGLSGSKQDIANAVLFLVSDAARFISGECIRVDGAACVDMLKVSAE
jgi:peroxisomal 2,4-dienoyl-CoA reductase